MLRGQSVHIRYNTTSNFGRRCGMLFFANENTGVLNLRGLNVKFRVMKLCHMALSPSCFFQKKWYYI